MFLVALLPLAGSPQTGEPSGSDSDGAHVSASTGGTVLLNTTRTTAASYLVETVYRSAGEDHSRSPGHPVASCRAFTCLFPFSRRKNDVRFAKASRQSRLLHHTPRYDRTSLAPRNRRDAKVAEHIEHVEHAVGSATTWARRNDAMKRTTTLFVLSSTITPCLFRFSSKAPWESEILHAYTHTLLTIVEIAFKFQARKWRICINRVCNSTRRGCSQVLSGSRQPLRWTAVNCGWFRVLSVLTVGRFCFWNLAGTVRIRHTGASLRSRD